MKQLLSLFVLVAVWPAGPACGLAGSYPVTLGSGLHTFANHLGVTLDLEATVFPSGPVTISRFDYATHNFATAIYDVDAGGWNNPSGVTLVPPGSGVFIDNASGAPLAFTVSGAAGSVAAPEARTADEFAAYGQSVQAFVLRVLQLMASHRAKTFAAIVSTAAPRSADPNLLRRDYSFLFERFFYYLEDISPTEMGLVVFDELEKAQSRILIRQMERYFLETEKGYQRSARIVPEPFFVHSDLTTAVQLADIVAYCLNWGMRLNRMTEPTPPDIEPFAKLAFDMRYVGKRFDEAGKEWPYYGVFYLDDLRPKHEREARD